MKQQLLEARLDRIRAMAEEAMRTGNHASTLMDIIRLIASTRGDA